MGYTHETICWYNEKKKRVECHFLCMRPVKHTQCCLTFLSEGGRRLRVNKRIGRWAERPCSRVCSCLESFRVARRGWLAIGGGWGGAGGVRPHMKQRYHLGYTFVLPACWFGPCVTLLGKPLSARCPTSTRQFVRIGEGAQVKLGSEL